MKLGFVINSLGTERAEYTTVRLARIAANRGHEAWLIPVANFIYSVDGSVEAVGHGPCPEGHDEQEPFFAALTEMEPERLSVDGLDVLLLRNDPAEDAEERPWAQTSGILFGQLAAERGVLVLNDPVHLADAINKTYFQHFPEKVRPRTCISSSPEVIKEFIDSEDGQAVIKPLQGSGGRSVFLIRPDDEANINQMIEAVTRDGYAIVQEYLEAAQEGDTRLFLMNGAPLEKDGKCACFKRTNDSGDARSNISAGGKVRPVEIGDAERRIAEIVRPKLMRDGMYLVGLDIVGDKLMEINVFSPGGLGIAEASTGVEFATVIIEDLERKVRLREHYGSSLDNVSLASL